MARIHPRIPHVPSVALLSVLIIVAGLVVLRRNAGQTGAAAQRESSEYPHLTSVEPLSPTDGAMCPWVSASASGTLVAAAAQGNSSGTSGSSSAPGSRTTVEADRAPLRVIRDLYPNYSAVAVNTSANEVFLQDENFPFGLKVFNRLENTPPQASFTEPKRVVSGSKTKMEYNCSLYIDPNNGDVYSLTNDVLDTLVVFPHDAKGNVAPKRELATPQATFGLAVDEEHEEIFLSVQQTSSVVVYRKTASGKEPPLRQLIGAATQMADPHGIAVDSKNDLLFVNNAGSSHAWDSSGKAIPASGKFTPPSITVYRLKASGNTVPLRVITGPKTQLNWPAGMYLDAEHGELYVANDGTASILVFRETDSGDVAPLRKIQGPKTGLRNPTGLFVDAKNQELWVANMGNHTATVYPRTANGDVQPLRTIRSAPPGQTSMVFANPSSLSYDSKRDQILVVN